MKDNFEAIKKMMNEFASQPLCERKNKPVSPGDFDENLKKLCKPLFSPSNASKA